MTQPVIPKPVGFMIYDTVENKFARKGVNNFVSRKGKVWEGMGPLKLHLQQYLFTNYYGDEGRIFKVLHSQKLANCVVYDITTGQPVTDFNILEYVKSCAESKLNEPWYKDKGYKIVLS